MFHNTQKGKYLAAFASLVVTTRPVCFCKLLRSVRGSKDTPYVLIVVAYSRKISVQILLLHPSLLLDNSLILLKYHISISFTYPVRRNLSSSMIFIRTSRRYLYIHYCSKIPDLDSEPHSAPTRYTPLHVQAKRQVSLIDTYASCVTAIGSLLTKSTGSHPN